MGIGDLNLCHNGEALLNAHLGIGRGFVSEKLVDHYNYEPDATLYLSRHNISNNHCVRIEWAGEASMATPLLDCFDMQENELWYGGYETFNQIWTINEDVRPMTPFLPRDFLSESSTSFGPILHPVWFSTRGVAVFVDKDVPLHVSINNLGDDNVTDRRICFQAQRYSLGCLPRSISQDTLKYTVCGFEDLTTAVLFFLNASSEGIHHPSSHPSPDVLRRPIWSTWAAMKTDVNQDKVLDFAQNITSRGYSISQLEIDDSYSDHYGDLEFSTTKFPDYSEFISSLESLGVSNVTAWVHPFINPDANDFLEATANVLPGTNTVDGNSIALTRWWNGYGAVINFVNESTRSWQHARLDNFVHAYNLTSLKFDAGGESYLPRCIYVENMTHPTHFSQAYVQFVSDQAYAPRAEVRVGYFSQAQPVLFRMLDRTSSWGLDNGLKSVLTTMLSLGIAGYPFVLPDMVGGNGTPHKHLFIRWLELNAFLPALQLSFPPWTFDQETEDITKTYIDLHEEIYDTYIRPLVNTAVNRGLPIIRPLWWIAPEDSQTHSVDDQFLVGNTLLVAPILEDSKDSTGSVNRSVYLPKGSWQCLAEACTNGTTFTGPAHLDFQVSLNDILRFFKNL